MTMRTGVPAEWGQEDAATINRLDAVYRRLSRRYVGRDRAIRLLQIAVLSREHLLLLGPPGTAKTDLVLRFSELIDVQRTFTYQLTRFTEPSEIFGPLDVEEFRNSVYRVRTAGMLPEAEIAFLDEVFQGSSAILNSLLTLINERRFYNGAQPQDTPLVTLIGASNDLPDDPVLRAFADRFLLRIELTPVADERLYDLLRLGWDREQLGLRGQAEPKERRIVSLAALSALSRRTAEVDLEPALPAYRDVVQELLAARMTLSDRRIVRGQKLVAAAAVLRNSTVAEPKDLWPLAYFWTDQADAPQFLEAVQGRVEADGGESLDPAPSVAHIVNEIETVHEQARRRLSAGTATPAIVDGELSRLTELRNKLLQYHPGAQQEIADADQKIKELISLMRDA
ncbi:MoxR-like ATPase [Thermocatellispora tengchongensis]|uniref:MoxR-like ATPase n=1 Tax=Thermocatellispora tengchongensis TaxID=1073253 RepID=A0A840P761_9ACTN|nr:AAA family ATPase [Thermocatellispora tengchongensis]MBB5134416.1 MoxR-like ATPase [Thermocatellispora tengchongensis]